MVRACCPPSSASRAVISKSACSARTLRPARGERAGGWCLPSLCSPPVLHLALRLCLLLWLCVLPVRAPSVLSMSARLLLFVPAQRAGSMHRPATSLQQTAGKERGKRLPGSLAGPCMVCVLPDPVCRGAVHNRIPVRHLPAVFPNWRASRLGAWQARCTLAAGLPCADWRKALR